MSAPEKHPEVVYRRTPDPGSALGSTERRRGYAPALAPLVIGFLILLALILALVLFTTFNDLGSLGLWDRLQRLIG